MSLRAASGSNVPGRFGKRAIFIGSGGGATGSLRFGAANNYYPSITTTVNLGGGSPTVQQGQQSSFLISQDCTSLTIMLATQILKPTTGLAALGNSIAFQQFYAVYNGIVVSVTLSSAMPATASDLSNTFFDPLPCASFSVAKFTKGTTIQLRCMFQSTVPATDKFPTASSASAIYGSTAASYFYDPNMASLSPAPNSTSNMSYVMKSFTATGGAAVGTTVTLQFVSVAGIINGNTYGISGATGAGNALFYNVISPGVVVTVDGGLNTVTYTAPSGAPTATATGTLSLNALNNNVYAKFGVGCVAFMILATHSLPSVGMFGDSKTFGTGDTPTTIGASGMTRLLFSDPTLGSTVFFGGCNFGNPSGIASDPVSVTTGNVALFESLYSYINYAVVGYGTNNSNPTLTTTLHSHLRAKNVSKIVQRSLTPRDSTVTGTSVTLTSATAVGTLVTATCTDTSQLFSGNTYTILGATGTGNQLFYNGSFAISNVVANTSFQYTATSGSPSASATGTLKAQDQFRTTAGQTIAASWGIGSLADTYNTTMKGLPDSDANMTYYESLGERFGTSGTSYWQWNVNGVTAFWETADGLHESAKGYEDNIGTAGNITTQSGTVSGTLRSIVAAFT